MKYHKKSKYHKLSDHDCVNHDCKKVDHDCVNHDCKKLNHGCKVHDWKNSSFENNTYSHINPNIESDNNIKCLINQCIICNDHSDQHIIPKKKYPLYIYSPYKITPHLPPETQYTSISKSSYSNFKLQTKKKSKQLPDTTLDNKEFCSYRKI